VGYGRPNAMPRKTPREDNDLEELDRAAAPRPKVADGQDASRGKRMFAGLLGTLRQSKSREEKEREILEKRKTIVAAVSGKSEEISRELKEAQYKAFIEKRDADEKVKFELDLKFKETEREYIEAQYAEWKSQLDEEGAILTMTEPFIVYKPANPTRENVEATAKSKERIEQWRASHVERIENAIQTIHRRRQETVERRAKARARGERQDDVDVDDNEMDEDVEAQEDATMLED